MIQYTETRNIYFGTPEEMTQYLVDAHKDGELTQDQLTGLRTTGIHVAQGDVKGRVATTTRMITHVPRLHIKGAE